MRHSVSERWTLWLPWVTMAAALGLLQSELGNTQSGVGATLVMLVGMTAVLLALSALTQSGSRQILIAAVAVGVLVAHPALDASLDIGPTESIQGGRMIVASLAAAGSVMVARGASLSSRLALALVSSIALAVVAIGVGQHVNPSAHLFVAMALGASLACIVGGVSAHWIGIRTTDRDLVAMGVLTTTAGAARTLWLIAGDIPITIGVLLVATVGVVLALYGALEGFVDALHRRDRSLDSDRVSRSVELARLTEESARHAEFIHDQRSSLLAIEAAALTLRDNPSEQLSEALAAEVARLKRRLDESSSTVGYFDVVEAIRPIIECARPLQGQIRFTHPQEARAWGNADQTVEMLLTLLDNAHQHGSGAIDVTLSATAHAVKISVADGGEGVHAALAEAVFERGVTTDPTSGSGLGLYVARNLARLHGGDITLSAENRAEFVITLSTRGPERHSTVPERQEPDIPLEEHG